MSIIYHKVWRDLWRNKTRTLLAMLSTAVGILALGMVVSMSDLMTGRMTGEWLASQPAYVSLSIIGGSIDGETATTLARTSGVTQIEPALSTTIHWKHIGETDWRNANLIARQDYGQQKLDMVRLTSGTWPRSTQDSVAVERQSVSAYNVPLDGQIIFKTGTDARKMTIVGVVHDVSAPTPLLGGDASFYITPDRLQDILGTEGYNQLQVRLAVYSKNEANAVGNQLKLHLEKMGLTVGTPQIHDPKRHYLQDNIDALLLIMTVLGVLSLGLSVFLIANTINAVLAQQISQIGMMKSVGATTGRVMRVYLIMVLAYGLLAVLVAVPLAALGANALAGLLLTVVNVESVSTQIVSRAVIIQLAVGLLAPMFAALWPVLTGARITVRQAVASYGLGADFGAGRMDRLIARVRGLPRPRFSPDGSRLAYALARRDPSNEQGWVAVSEGTRGTSRLIATSPAQDYFWVAAWLDSDTIILQSGMPPQGVWSVRADGSNLKQLADGIFLGMVGGTVQDCGQVQMRGPNPPTDVAGQPAENCIWSAYQQKSNARLIVSIMGVDTVETHNITIANKSGQAVITDLVEHTIVPARVMPSQTYTCAALEQKQNGLLFKSCGDEGDFSVPAPASQ